MYDGRLVSIVNAEDVDIYEIGLLMGGMEPEQVAEAVQ